MTILQNEKVTLEEMHHMFHKYQTTPVYNDEGDPLVGWSLTEDWRADATYAAIVTKVNKILKKFAMAKICHEPSKSLASSILLGFLQLVQDCTKLFASRLQLSVTKCHLTLLIQLHHHL